MTTIYRYRSDSGETFDSVEAAEQADRDYAVAKKLAEKYQWGYVEADVRRMLYEMFRDGVISYEEE